MDTLNQPFQLQRTVETVSRLVKRGATATYLSLLQKLRPAEVAQILINLKGRDRIEVFEQTFTTNPSLSATILSEMLAEEHGLDVLENLTVEEISDVLQHLPPDDAAHLLSFLPEDRHEEVLSLMELDHSLVAQELLQFPEYTAGRIMTPDVFRLREDVTISEAIASLQSSTDRLEMVFYLYVVDDRNHLVGVVALRQLLLNPPNTPLKRLMSTDVIKVHAEDDQESVARIVAQFNIVAVPVVDSNNKLIGMVTVDDVIDVMREEATEDLFALAGVESDDRAMAKPFRSLRTRFPWLVLSLVSALVPAFVVSRFQDMFSSKLALAAMLPIFATIGGNAATQTLTVIVRSLSLGEVGEGTERRIFVKEVMVGLSNGLVFGLVLTILVGIWQQNLQFALVVGLATICNLVVASIAGSLSPLLIRKLGVDPVLASSAIAITTTEALGFFSYLGLAWLLFHWIH